MPLHPVFEAAAGAAHRAHDAALGAHSRRELEEVVMQGADGTPTMRIDLLVESAIVDATAPFGVNILSEEVGFVDRASRFTLVVDPLDGSANAAAGVPLACFSAALADDEQFVQALTVWLETGRRWEAVTGSSGPNRTTGASTVAGSAISMLRPHARNRDAWMAISDRAERVRILSCSTLEACLVAQGSTDAFLDAGSDTHRLVDLAAAAVLLPACGGVLTDVFERPIVFDLDQTRRWSGIVAASAALAAELAELVRAHTGPISSFT